MNAKFTRRHTLAALTLAATALSPFAARAEDTVKIGLILPMTGPSASTGREIDAAIKLFQEQKGDKAAGKKVEVIVKDDTGVADITKRLAQELVVNDKVERHRRLRPDPARHRRPRRSPRNAKVPMIVMAAGTSIITEASPYIVRTCFTLPQNAAPIADWARRTGHEEGRDARLRLRSGHRRGKDLRLHHQGRRRRGSRNLRVPLANPDFAPFLQKVADLKPQALLAFVPSGVGAQFMKQFVERGLDKSGIKLIGTGDVTDDDILNGMGDVALGVITSHHYSAAHDSPENKAFVDAFRKANPGLRPNFMAVGGYDGMHADLRRAGQDKGRHGRDQARSRR